jgi:hypothetical protein
MNRPTWISRPGEPVAVMELALWRTAVAAVVGKIVNVSTHDFPTSIVVMCATYLVVDRIQIVAEWVVEIVRERRADKRMLAALNRHPVRDHMAVRPYM